MTQPIPTSRAGIVINFYGRRGHLQPLQKSIGLALNLPRAQGDHVHDDMSDSTQGIALYLADPPNAPDSTVIHLAVGDPTLEPVDDAPTVWEKWLTTFREADFEPILDGVMATKNEAGEDVFWGYSLIFHAAFEPTTYHNDGIKPLLKLARRSDLPPWSEAESLVESTLAGSHLWLMDTPNQQHGFQAASVYLALMPLADEPTLLTRFYHGRSALLLNPDLIAHKTAYQRRQFVNISTDVNDSPQTLYKKQLLALPNLIAPLLGKTIPHQPNMPTNQAEQLRKLNKAYSLLLYTTSLLNEPHLSLAEQKKNYEWYRDQFNQNKLYEYHYLQIKLFYEELGLLLDKGQAMLDAARTATEMVQTNLSQAEAQRERITQAILAIVGIAFACPQLIDPTAAQAILHLLTGQVMLDDTNRLIQLAVQLGLTGISVMLGLFLIRLRRKN